MVFKIRRMPELSGSRTAPVASLVFVGVVSGHLLLVAWPCTHCTS